MIHNNNYTKAIDNIFCLITMFEKEESKKYVEIFVPIRKKEEMCRVIDSESNMSCFKYKTKFSKNLQRKLLNSKFFQKFTPAFSNENKTKSLKDLQKKLLNSEFSHNISYVSPSMRRGVFIQETVIVKLHNTYYIKPYIPTKREFKVLFRPQELGGTDIYATILIVNDY